MTDAEIETLRDAMDEQRDEIRSDLADAGVDVSSWTVPDEDETDATESG